VKSLVQPILEESRGRSRSSDSFVDVLLALQGDQKLPDDDMISVLWEMVFRGTDTIAVLMEWAMAEVILNPSIQAQIHKELDTVVGRNRLVQLKDMEQLPYVQAVLKETLRSHPPGPLLSWARLASEDTEVAGYHVPRDTTAMVNMWAITHDATVWSNPHAFDPSRFLEDDLDVLGTELRLAPFGSGRRVCPGRALGMATAQLWLARLLHHFSWSQDCHHPIDLSDNLKLSCEMASPLHGCATSRIPL
jgi:cytochrome P450